MSSEMFSIGAPFSRNASVRSPSPPPRVWAWSRRVMVSGLYWKTITLASGLRMSSPTRAPFIRRGDPGKLVIKALRALPRRAGGMVRYGGLTRNVSLLQELVHRGQERRGGGPAWSSQRRVPRSFQRDDRDRLIWQPRRESEGTEARIASGGGEIGRVAGGGG